ncbi:MAG: hypothetical protein ACRD9W_14915 [Terriglobia bacterium]
MNINEIIDDFLKESEVDYIAMWEVAEVARDDLNAKTDDEARRISLELVCKLHDHGLRPGDYWGGGFGYWSDNGCQAAVDRIEREWVAAGEDPNLGEPICWLGRPDKQD